MAHFPNGWLEDTLAWSGGGLTIAAQNSEAEALPAAWLGLVALQCHKRCYPAGSKVQDRENNSKLQETHTFVWRILQLPQPFRDLVCAFRRRTPVSASDGDSARVCIVATGPPRRPETRRRSSRDQFSRASAQIATLYTNGTSRSNQALLSASEDPALAQLGTGSGKRSNAHKDPLEYVRARLLATKDPVTHKVEKFQGGAEGVERGGRSKPEGSELEVSSGI